ncbi:MAG: hypothetical protein H0T73_20075, partial [Ardenticatenales bacterium]|nr:hypothetical protein [Ardenticatenales bacterium]
MDKFQILCEICQSRAELDQTRLTAELEEIQKNGLTDQFYDLYNSGHTGTQNNVNCLVAYALGITTAYPEGDFQPRLRYVSARVSMPDIDIDFPDDRRHELIEYTVQKYGADKCAAIITFGSLGARAAVRDVGRAMDIPLSDVDRVARLVPNVPGKPVRLDKLLFDDHTAQEWPAEAADLRQVYKSDAIVRNLLDTAIKLEGQTRHASTHAAGVVISDRPIVEYAPLHRPTKGDESGPIQQVVQFDMNIVESIGLLKVDFLGLATLSIMRRACEHIEQRHGRRLDLNTIPYERRPEDSVADADVMAAYKQIQSGNTVGIFQVEGCLSGDTNIGHRTIKELFEDFTRRQSEASISGRKRLKAVSCYLDSGKLTFNEITNVVYSGIKPVYRLVNEDGQWIKATADHYFLTQRGWVRLADIDPTADKLLFKSNTSRTSQLCIDCDQSLKTNYKRAQRCKSCAAHLTSNPSRPEVKIRISESRKGSPAWNKGLTAETAADTAWIQNLAKYNESQRGLTYEERFGPERAASFKAFLSERWSGKKNPMYGRPPGNRKKGYREDLGHFVRSTWEADLARVLRYLNLEYLYESKTFELITKEGQTLNYTPDFYIPVLDTWIEVKGWMDQLSAEKISLFKEQYSDHKLIIVDQTLFAEFQHQYKNLVEWECPRFPSNSRWVSIRSIDYVGEEETYDIQMRPPGNNFVANGFIVHNSGMRRTLQEMRPDQFEHIIAAISLYRPGPMEYIPAYIRRMHGEEPVTYHHKAQQPILENTYGIAVYQEQLMRMATDIAGYSPGEADLMRRAVSKKKAKDIEYHKGIFVDGAVKRGMDRESAEKIYADIEFFARYGFNKSHAADYAVITVQTAYLKAHYPVEYLCALLEVEFDDSAKVPVFITECRRLGIAVLPPDINGSGAKFTIELNPAN